jgi:acyl-CoA synthetase (AMP-forming)/AMP-acid ligase II
MHWNIADIFESVADVVGERVAVVSYRDGGRRVFTYAELEARSNQLAHVLRDRGVQPGDHVGFYLYNTHEILETHLAAWKIRAVPINVNYRYVTGELEYLFDNADLVAIVHGREFTPTIATVLPQLPKLTTCIGIEDGSDADLATIDALSYEPTIAAASPARDFDERSDDDLYVLYTGGTTGLPKGVMWRQEDFYKSTIAPLISLGQPIITDPAEQAVAALATGGTLTMFPLAPLMHGAAQWVALMSLLKGDRQILTSARRFDPKAIWEIVAAEQVNALTIVGDAMGRPLVEALDDPTVARETSSLYVIGSGGAILSPAVKQQINQRLPNVIISDSIGASETGYQGTLAGADEQGRPRFTMGPHTIVIGEDGKPVVPGSGIVGRLARRGFIPLGYYKDPEKTAETFPTLDGQRWVLPGDMATVDADGTITLLGRGSVSINSGGEKIYPEEVESVLKADDDVFDAVVVGVPDEKWGERITAVVKARPGANITLASLHAHCQGRIADYKIPRGLVLVDEIVRSPSGKPDYRWAKAIAVEAANAG